MSSINNEDRDRKTNPFHGKAMPAKPKNMIDDDGPTRRVGGRGAPAPAMVAPCAMPVPFAMPQSMQRQGFGESINTAPMKAMTSLDSSRRNFVWNIHSVPTLPEFYPLERSAVFLPHAQPSMVGQRVSNLLRDLSVEAIYDDDKAKVKCVTNEGVDFRIRLYRGRNQYSHGIIAEVQRRFGFSLNFHFLTKAILDAVEGKKTTSLMSLEENLPMVSDDEEYECPPPPSGSSSLKMVSKLLDLPGFDSQCLGMQTLSSLVDANKMGITTARAVSMELLKPDCEVGKKVFAYILSRNSDEVILNLRVMALDILANSMFAIGKLPEFLRASLRPVLIKDLRNAETHPRTALMAARCLEYFIRGDSDTMELNDTFEFAMGVGEAKHVSLMNQAQRCIANIG